MNMNRLNHKLLLCAAALAATSVAGCADGKSGLNEESEDLGLQAPPAPTTTTPDKNGVYFAEVTGTGLGCPAGSWNTSISADGLAFTLTFSQYDIEIDETKAVASKDCTLNIKLHSPQGVSYGVSEFYYSGYAYLLEGVAAEQTAQYWFQGTAAKLENQNRTTLPGLDPVTKKPLLTWDSDFNFRDTLRTEDVVFSACGTDRLLNVKTRLTLKNGQNGKPRSSGFANLAAIDANTRLEFKFATKPCGDGGVGIVIPDAGPVRRPR
jgi:hypothetical protein